MSFLQMKSILTLIALVGKSAKYDCYISAACLFTQSNNSTGTAQNSAEAADPARILLLVSLC